MKNASHLLMTCLMLFLAAGSVFAAEIDNGKRDLPVHDVARTGTGPALAEMLKAERTIRDLRNAQGSTPLHLAATNPDLGPLKILLAAGADVNARDVDGLTPLHMAAYTQNAKHARLLLESGADPYAKTNAGRDPTSMARKTMANEVAGVISLWILKGCVAGKPC